MLANNATLLTRGWTPAQLEALQTHIESLDIENIFEFADNFRIARVGNWTEEKEYDDAKAGGCCGFHDVEIECPDGNIMYGFNYGH